MNDVLLEARGLSKNFDGVKALADFSASVHKGEILGLLGPNGAGKTTLFNVISGFIEPDQGELLYNGKNIKGCAPHIVSKLGVSRTFQNLRLIRQISVLDNVLLSFHHQSGERLEQVFFNPKRSRIQEAENHREALALLDSAGLKGKAVDTAEALSYGQQKLLSLVCCLATQSNLVMLDEPVAGIAPEMTERILAIIEGLPSQGRSVILIEHNIEAVMRVCDRVIFMDAGAIVSEGSPDAVRSDPKVVETYLD